MTDKTEMSKKTPGILIPALRQYQHNDCSGLLAGFDYEETVKIVTEIQTRFVEQACETIKKEIRDEMDSIDNEIGYSTSHKEGYEYAMERAQQVIKDKFK